MKNSKRVVVYFFRIVFFSFIIFISSTLKTVAGDWLAPVSSSSLINPLKNDVGAIAEGKKTYVHLCVVCHGDKGRGDGLAGMALTPRPANLTISKVQSQTDGALFWKITNGRPPMAAYQQSLSETQRWQLVNYIRTFGTLNKPKKK